MNLNDEAKAKEELDRAVSSGHPEAIARAAMNNIWPLYSSHAAALTAAVGTLPSAYLERYPVLRIVHPLTPVLARTTRPFKPLMYPDEGRTMTPEELDITTLVQMIAFRISGDVAAALIYARRLEDRILQTRVEARERTDGPLWFYHHQIGSTLLAAGDSSRALLEFATSRQIGAFALQEDAERLALGREALAHAVRGSLGEADKAMAEIARQPQPTTAHENSSRSTEKTAAALIAVDRMVENVDEVLAELEPYDSIELTWPFALLARARSFLARQRPEDALEILHLASDSHPAQHGSFASDVITSMSIKALLALGDLERARPIAEANLKTGVLTRLAAVRVALHDGRYDAAAKDLRLIGGDLTLGPAQRADTVLLTGWLQLARSRELDHETGLQIFRIALKGDHRRLLATMPRQLIDRVRDTLPADLRSDFDGVIAGLNFFEMRARPSLTSGELRVLNALPSHSTIAQMASAFHVSPNTVKTQLKSLYRKLDCSTREDAIRIGARLHLLGDELSA